MSELQIAIVGCGGMAGAHARHVKNHSNARIVGLCDVSEEIVYRFIEKNLSDYEPRPAIHTDRAALYAETRPQAVVIATPHTMHFEHCMEALEHDCDVLVEKPMVTSAEHARLLKQQVNRTGRILVIGYNTPCTPQFHYLREQIRNRAFGGLELISGYVVQNWKGPVTGSWRQNPELSGGGQAYDTGAHLLNSLCWSVESRVTEVLAYQDHQDAPVDINSTINVRFANGVLAAVAIGGNCASSGGYLMYAFEGGRVMIDGWMGSWIEVHDRNGRVEHPPIEGTSQTPTDNFIDAILGDVEPRTNVDNGVVQSELMDAIYESARTGRPARPT